MNVAEAKKRGHDAFHSGKKCVPALDGNFGTLACRAEGSTVELMTAWHRGWTLANLAAPLDVCCDFHRGEIAYADCGGSLETCDDGELRCDAHADSFEYNREAV